jgi:uncharacterized RDD family membrane protein YckC
MTPHPRASSEPLDTTTDIETPEHIRFRYRAAGPVRRGLAYMLDTLIRAFVMLLFVVFLSLGDVVSQGSLQGLSTGLVLVVLFGLEWGYFVLFETLWNGGTPGKKALKLRVVKEGGHPITFVDSVLRNLLRAADFLPPAGNVGSYAVGVLVMASDQRFRRLGDLVAGTMVIVEERQDVAAPVRIYPPPSPAELEGLPARPHLLSAEREALDLFVRRVGTLSPAREAELAEMVAPKLAHRFGVPYADPSRFLSVLYHRMTVTDGAASPRMAP